MPSSSPFSYAVELGSAFDGNPRKPTTEWNVGELRAWVDELASRLVGTWYAKSKRGHHKKACPKSKAAKGSHTAAARILKQRPGKCQ